MLPMSNYEAVKNATVDFWRNARDPKANVLVGFTSTQNEVSTRTHAGVIQVASFDTHTPDSARSRSLLQRPFTASGALRRLPTHLECCAEHERYGCTLVFVCSAKREHQLDGWATVRISESRVKTVVLLVCVSEGISIQSPSQTFLLLSSMLPSTKPMCVLKLRVHMPS